MLGIAVFHSVDCIGMGIEGSIAGEIVGKAG